MPCKHRFAFATLACALMALAPPVGSAQADSAAATSQLQTLEKSETAKALFTAEVFYEVLLGELSTERGNPDHGYALILDAARRSQSDELYRRATEIALQSHSAASALTAAQAWLQAKPQSRDANRHVLRILVALNRIADSLAPLEHELAAAPANQKIAVINAIPLLYAHASDKELAAAVTQEALGQQIKDPATAANAWTSVGRVRLAAGNKIGALIAARLAHKADAGNDAMVALALQLLDEKVDEAEPLLHPYLDGDALPEIRMGYARHLAQSNQFKAALVQMHAITSEQPDNAQALMLQATMQLQAREVGAAEKTLNQFTTLSATLPHSEQSQLLTRQMYLLRSEIAQQRGDLAEAEHWLSLIEDDNSRMGVLQRRATLLARQGRLGEGLALIRNLPTASDEETARKLTAEASVLREVGQFDRAYEAQTRAAALQPQDDDLIYDQAMLAERLGNMAQTEQLLRSILARNPKYYHALNALGFSLADRGVRLQEAKALIEQALELAPKDPYITDSLGWVEYRLGNKQRALQLLQEAMRTQPDPEIAAHLGEVLWKLGDHAKARAAWRAGLRLKHDSPVLLQTLKRFGEHL